MKLLTSLVTAQVRPRGCSTNSTFILHIAFSDCVDLTHNTNLRSLYILNFDIRGSFLKIIQRISSICLTDIRIGVWVQDCADLAWLGCKKVADELNHPRFSELQSVYIGIICASGQEDEAIDQLRREMSGLDNRGILTVEPVLEDEI
jgi:hypothetical protein